MKFSTLLLFLQMSGYGKYVFPAYGLVILFLLLQWTFSWRKWKHYLRTQQQRHE